MCMGAHSQPLPQNHLMDLMKLGIDEKLKAPKCFKAFGQIQPGADPGWDKIGYRGPFLKKLLLQSRKLISVA